MATENRYLIDSLNDLVDALGEVQTTPTANTLLDRVKDLLTGIVLAAGTAIIGKVDTTPATAASADVHEPAANTAAVVTYTATSAVKHCITGVAWSYSGGIPTGGNLLVEDVSGTTVFTFSITEEGPGFVIFPSPKKGAAVNTAMIVTLAAGGSGITGKVSVLNHWTEA